ncbi:MAG: prenyltransferase/squalene oxidase repeat-containing protein [Verrucomicrobiales bacterium]|nr:prenyltransferase/squalene oxidase repeat-containing protein [Verrucomicrobiales bacterium]
MPTPHQTLQNTRSHLLAGRNPTGTWTGELSTSALSTATAALALDVVDPNKHADLITAASTWLAKNQNPDGGWGDTTISFSNISTTLLATAALNRVGGFPDAITAANAYITKACGSLEPDAITRTVVARYGKDRTFSVPILMACTLGGLLGDPAKAWHRVLPLPFELAACPRSWFATLRLPVVSYALPALIAIGYARYFHAPPSFAPLRWIRKKAWPSVSKLLGEIQPASGGFLEAAPLTCFVTMALASTDARAHSVIANAVRFLKETIRPDGSHPIDTNLATWTTTLATKALLTNPQSSFPNSGAVSNHLLLTQYKEKHPFTESQPGGWAWTDLTGGVPDADDTPGALIALHLLNPKDSPGFAKTRNAAIAGTRWLLDLQNRDGGIPTFCRGWGALPFDRSSPDLTAHTLRAWNAWLPELPGGLADESRWAIRKALTYLTETQNPDHSWTPLWFGNQHLPDETNNTYGTTNVLKALSTLPPTPDLTTPAISYLLENQNPDNGWGGGKRGYSPSTIEETALAQDALASFPATPRAPLDRAATYLTTATKNGTHFPPSPIGFYFAKLWYHEKIYPLAWTAGALASYNAFKAPSTHPAPSPRSPAS